MSRNLPDKYLFNCVSDYKRPRSQLLLPADTSMNVETLGLSSSPFCHPCFLLGPTQYFNKCLLNEWLSELTHGNSYCWSNWATYTQECCPYSYYLLSLRPQKHYVWAVASLASSYSVSTPSLDYSMVDFRTTAVVSKKEYQAWRQESRFQSQMYYLFTSCGRI